MKKLYLLCIAGILGMVHVTGQTPYKNLEGNIPVEKNKVYNKEVSKKEFLSIKQRAERRSAPPSDTLFTWVSFEEAAMDEYDGSGGTQSIIIWNDSLVVLTSGNTTFNWYIHGYAQVFDPNSQFIENYYNLGITEYNDWLTDSLGIYYFYDRTADTTIIMDTIWGAPSTFYSFTVDGDTVSVVKGGSSTMTNTYTQSDSMVFYSHTINGDTVMGQVIYSIDSTYTYMKDTGSVLYDSTLNMEYTVVTYGHDTGSHMSILTSVLRYAVYNYTIDTATSTYDSTMSASLDTFDLDSTVVAGSFYDSTLNMSYTIISYGHDTGSHMSILSTVMRYGVYNYNIDTLTSSAVDSTMSATLDTFDLASTVVAIYDTVENTAMVITNYDYQSGTPTAITDTVYRWPLNSYTIDIDGDTTNTDTENESKLFLDSAIVYAVAGLDTTYGPVDTLYVHIIPYNDLDYTSTGPYWFGQEPYFGAVLYDVAKDKPKGNNVATIPVYLDHSHNTGGQLGYMTLDIGEWMVDAGEQLGAAFQYKSGMPYQLGDTLLDQNTTPFSLTKVNMFELLSYEEVQGEQPLFWEDDIPYSSGMHTRNESHVLVSECKYDPASSWYEWYITTLAYTAPYTHEHIVLDWNIAATGVFFDYAVNNGCEVQFSPSSNAGVTSWKWTFGDGGSSFDQIPSHNYSLTKETETVSVCVIGTNDSNGKKYTTCRDISVSWCTGIDENELSKLVTLHPNPTNGILNINFELGSNEDVQVKVFDMLGSQVFENTYLDTFNTTHQLDLSDKPAGIYFVNIKTDDGTITKKVTLTR